jgi:uncharacterized protein YndB with AHSA1/START domain
MSNDQISMFGDAPEIPADEPRGKPVSFSITRTFNAPAQKVFDQWLIPVFIEEWMFHPDIAGESVQSLDNTVRKGGSFLFKIKKAGQDIDYSGDYIELRMPSELRFSWNKNGREDRRSEIALRFDEDGGKTRMRLVMSLDPALSAQKEQIKAVWTARCGALAERLK